MTKIKVKIMQFSYKNVPKNAPVMDTNLVQFYNVYVPKYFVFCPTSETFSDAAG